GPPGKAGLPLVRSSDSGPAVRLTAVPFNPHPTARAEEGKRIRGRHRGRQPGAAAYGGTTPPPPPTPPTSSWLPCQSALFAPATSAGGHPRRWRGGGSPPPPQVGLTPGLADAGEAQPRQPPAIVLLAVALPDLPHPRVMAQVHGHPLREATRNRPLDVRPRDG